MYFSESYDYIYEDESDEDGECLSSGDEGVYQDVATGRLTLRTKKAVCIEDDDDEDFEQLMNRELDDRMMKVPSNNKHQPSTSKETKPNEYDSIYFDSDEETDNKESSHKIISNDELLYDPQSDNEDQKWIDKRRKRYLPPQNINQNTGKIKPLPQSDAILNCPGCMTMLCLDCQRHDVYHSQFRAMFVFNCTINTEETLDYPLKTAKKKKKAPLQSTPEKYNPVKCSVCSTEVAVYDKDEVYHFFNIIASHS